MAAHVTMQLQGLKLSTCNYLEFSTSPWTASLQLRHLSHEGNPAAILHADAIRLRDALSYAMRSNALVQNLDLDSFQWSASETLQELKTLFVPEGMILQKSKTSWSGFTSGLNEKALELLRSCIIEKPLVLHTEYAYNLESFVRLLPRIEDDSENFEDVKLGMGNLIEIFGTRSRFQKPPRVAGSCFLGVLSIELKKLNSQLMALAANIIGIATNPNTFTIFWAISGNHDVADLKQDFRKIKLTFDQSCAVGGSQSQFASEL